MVVTTSSDGARMRADAPAPAGPPVVPGLRSLVSDPAIPRLWLGWMDSDPVRVLLVEGGRIPFEPVVAALERLRPATEHRFASRLRGCHVLGTSGLAVVTDHHPLGSLERVVARSGPGSEAEALTMASELCEAIAHCHGVGFVHGHIGPGTVMLGDDGHPRVAAHGALGELEAGLGVRPTPPGIVPPEGRPSAAGDVYAMALIAVYAATGMLDPRAMPKRWAPLIGPALDIDPARRPNDLVMFAAGMRSVADALRAGAAVAVIDVPGAPLAATRTAAAGTAAAVTATRAAGPQAVVDGLQLNKIPRRSGRRMAVLGSVAVLATAGIAAGAIYAATRDDDSPSTTVPINTVATNSVPSNSAAPGSVTTLSTTTLPTTTLPTTTLPTTTVPATTVPVTQAPVTVPVTDPPASSTTRRTATTKAPTTRASTPTTRTSTPSSSPGTTTASTLPPDVERGKD